MRCVVRSRDSALPWGPVQQRVASTFLLPVRMFPQAPLGISRPPRLPQLPRHLRTRRPWRNPTRRPGPPITRPTPPPPLTVLSMLRVQPRFAWRLELPGRKRARIEFVAATWEVDVEMQAGERTPAFRISFPSAIKMAGVQLKDGEQLVGLYACQLRGGHWKLETAVRGRQRVA